jgi:hypothetical protein
MTVILGDSHDPATMEQLVEALDGEPIDMLFIDGDHTYAGVWADTHLVLDHGFVRPGGLVVYHDIVACAGDVGRPKAMGGPRRAAGGSSGGKCQLARGVGRRRRSGQCGELRPPRKEDLRSSDGAALLAWHRIRTE